MEGIVSLVEYLIHIIKNPIEILFLIIGGFFAYLTVVWLSGEPSLQRGGFVIIIIPVALAVLVGVTLICRWLYNSYKKGFQNILNEDVTTDDHSLKSHIDTRNDSNNDSNSQYEIPLNEENTHRQQSSTAQNTGYQIGSFLAMSFHKLKNQKTQKK